MRTKRLATTASSLAVATCLLIGLFLVPASTNAQEVIGTLYGRVFASDKSLLPGVTVTITSPQLIGGAVVRTTNELGAYRVPALPAGLYTVTAELSGFQTGKRENIRLEAGAALAIEFDLSVGTLAESVTVSGAAPLVDVRSMQTTRTVDKEVIENVPVTRRFSELLTIAPGVTDSEYQFAPAQTVHGGSVRDNVSNVDGANINDNTVGYTFTDLAYDSIEEVQVTTGGISAEFGQASGAVFSFVTKSGGNQLSGSLNTTFLGKDLQWDNLDADLLSKGITQGSVVKRNVEYGGTLGGPIKRDRLWYFGNLRMIDVVNILPAFTATNPNITDKQGFVKLTTQLTNRSRLQGSYTQNRHREDPSNGNANNNNAPEVWTNETRYQKILFLSLNQTLRNNAMLEASVSQTLQHWYNFNHQVSPGYRDLNTSQVWGGRTGPRGDYPVRQQRSIKASFSRFTDRFLGGSHNFKTGYQTEFAPLWRGQDDLIDDLVHLVRNGVPYRVDLYNTPIMQGRNVLRHAGFVQDVWTVGDRVTLNLGARLERSEGYWPEQQGGGGKWTPVTNYPEKRNVILWKTFAPRLGVVWDVRGDHSTSVKFSVGRYYGTLLNQYLSLALPNNSGFQEFDWIDRNGDLRFQDGEQGILRSSTVPSKDVYDPDLENPYTNTFHFGIDQQLGKDFALGVIGIIKRDRDILETIDIGRPFSAYDTIAVTNKLTGEPFTIYALKPSFLGSQQILKLTNPTDPVRLKRNYEGVEMVLRRRLSEKWGAQASLNLGRSRGNIGNSFDASVGGTGLYDNPNTLINSEGPLDLDTPMQFKMLGMYRAPAGILLSSFYTALSGWPLGSGSYTVRYTSADTPRIVVESQIDVNGAPRGTYRVGFRNRVSARAEKQFALGAKRRLSLVADVFNLLNINTVDAYSSLRLGDPNFLRPSRIERPRSVQFSARYAF